MLHDSGMSVGSMFVSQVFDLSNLHIIVLNHYLSQNLDLIRKGKFSHLIDIITFSLTCGLKLFPPLQFLIYIYWISLISV